MQKELQLSLPFLEEIDSRLVAIEKKLELLNDLKSVKPVLSPKEVAEILGKSIRTLQNWRNDNRGPIYSQEGDNIWYLAENVMKFLKEHEIGSHNYGGPGNE